MKKCTICTVEKDVIYYNKNKSKPDGLNNICKECSRLASKKYYKNNRALHRSNILIRNRRIKAENQEFVCSILEKSSCLHCGESNPLVLEFDHLRDKDYSVSKLAGTHFAKATLEREIAKCQILCANCHRIKTHRECNSYRYKRFSR